MNDDQIGLILIGLILLVGLGLPAGILIWFIKNVVTPIGTIENLAWALDSTNPWVWVGRLMLIAVMGLISVVVGAWIKEKIGL
jgi:hypothetical protein